jgi:hypothetical protein
MSRTTFSIAPCVKIEMSGGFAQATMDILLSRPGSRFRAPFVALM